MLNKEASEDASLRLILGLLADGQYHSGQELGDRLGVSRTAVWKHLQKLESLGLRLSTIKGKGYCLDGGLDLLDAEAIRQRLSSAVQSLLTELDIHMVVDSTNNYAMNKAAGSGYACLAEQQTSGKGRRGRVWVSPFGKNVYLSLLWQFEGGAAALEGLSLAVGVAIADALARCGLTGVQLKWPNDVLWCKQKLAGVLLEMTGDPSGVCQVVVGVGINASMPKNSASVIDQPWVDVKSILSALDSSAQDVTRNQLVAALLMELLPLLQTYTEKKFDAYRQSWQSLNAYADQRVELHTAKAVIAGTMLGVNEVGALKLQTDKGEELFYGGEVSLRVAL